MVDVEGVKPLCQTPANFMTTAFRAASRNNIHWWAIQVTILARQKPRDLQSRPRP